MTRMAVASARRCLGLLALATAEACDLDGARSTANMHVVRVSGGGGPRRGGAAVLA
jgi:hypothetical protein